MISDGENMRKSINPPSGEKKTKMFKTTSTTCGHRCIGCRFKTTNQLSSATKSRCFPLEQWSDLGIFWDIHMDIPWPTYCHQGVLVLSVRVGRLAILTTKRPSCLKRMSAADTGVMNSFPTWTYQCNSMYINISTYLVLSWSSCNLYTTYMG